MVADDGVRVRASERIEGGGRCKTEKRYSVTHWTMHLVITTQVKQRRCVCYTERMYNVYSRGSDDWTNVCGAWLH